MDIRKRIRIIFFCESASLFQENAFYPLMEMSSQRAQNAGKEDASVNILMYEGSLSNRVPLCGELGLAAWSNDARETELAILSAGYRRWGNKLPCHLYGSFAFVIRDEEGQLFCARDAFGIQTFYYCETDNGVLLYGCDLREITKSPQYRKALDRQALQLYALFGYPVGCRTLYAGIRKLPPGCMLIWNGTNVRINRWHTLSFHPNPTVSEEAWAEEIDRNLQEILNEDRARFDFSRCGSFLSGGVDSSYLLASSGVREAFGIGFEEAEVSELPAAAAAARAMGARLHEVRIRAEEFFDAIPRFLRNLELPLADLCAPFWALGCERAAEKSSVCLSGEGADEFFGGYYVYARADELGREGALYCGCSGIMKQEAGMQLLGDEKAVPLESLVAECSVQTQSAEPLSRMLAVDTALWLEGDILFGVGRSARANGIELLLPFSDRRMFALSAAIPSTLKRKDGTAKYILRKAAEKRLPHEIAFRRKQGFSVPVQQWFREERFRPQIERALFGSVSGAYFDQALLRDRWNSFLNGDDRDWTVLYMVYIFVLWYENCFEAT